MPINNCQISDIPNFSTTGTPTEEEWDFFADNVSSQNLYEFDPLWLKKMTNDLSKNFMEQVKKNKEETRDFFRTHPDYEK